MTEYEMARPNETELTEMAESGLIPWKELALAALGWMDDAEVGRMAENEGLMER